MPHTLPPLFTAYHGHGRHELPARVDRVALPITHDPEDAPRIGDVYECREVVDRAESNDGRSVTLWFAEET